MRWLEAQRDLRLEVSGTFYTRRLAAHVPTKKEANISARLSKLLFEQ
jgi:hypothetical protein